MKNVLNFYFRFPVTIDFIITLGLLFAFNKYVLNNLVILPTESNVRELASETVTILLTLSGFILTFLTVLISLKIDSSKSKANDESNMSLIEKFCESGLYFDTTTIFKNSIKEIITVSVLIYIVRLFYSQLPSNSLYIFTIGGIIILILTILRNLWILGEILNMQKPVKKA